MRLEKVVSYAKGRVKACVCLVLLPETQHTSLSLYDSEYPIIPHFLGHWCKKARFLPLMKIQAMDL